MTAPQPPHQVSPELPSRWRGARSRRLASALATYRVGLDQRRTRAQPQSPAQSPAVLAFEECFALLGRAEDAYRRRDLGGGWAFLLEAQRSELGTLTPEQRQSRVVALREEVADKLGAWRRTAAVKLLGDGAGSCQPNLDQVKEAVQIRNEHFHNQYHKLDLTRVQLMILGGVLLAGLVGLDLMVGLGRFRIGELDWLDLLTLMVVGGLGGSLSAVRSLAGRSERKIPDQLADWPVTALRPLLGAAAATGIALLVQAGVVRFGAVENQDQVLRAVAFLAGFSERWFLGVIGSVSGGTKDRE